MIIEYQRTYSGRSLRCWLCGWRFTVTDGRVATVICDPGQPRTCELENARICERCIQSGEEGMRRKMQTHADRLRITARSVQECADRLKAERIYLPGVVANGKDS